VTECRRFRIEGRVQGVWFRESTRQQAVLHEIRGYAINCPDGSVEVLACGEEHAIQALRDWLRKGPPLAEVDEVREWPFDGDCPEGFKTG